MRDITAAEIGMPVHWPRNSHAKPRVSSQRCSASVTGKSRFASCTAACIAVSSSACPVRKSISARHGPNTLQNVTLKRLEMIYVDDMKAKFYRYLMSHMIADTDEELLAMADKIGVDRKWHQAPPKHDSHFDIAQTKVELALQHGAIQITLRQCAAMNYRRRLTGKLGSPDDAIEWMLASMEERKQARAAVEVTQPEEVKPVAKPAERVRVIRRLLK
jgi:hypothetical protein